MAEESKVWGNIGKLFTILSIIAIIVGLYKTLSEKGYSIKATGTIYPFKVPDGATRDSVKSLDQYTSLWYFVIENNGDKPLEDLKLELPIEGTYQLDIPEKKINGNFKGSISIGGLNPSYNAVIYVWVSDNSATVDNSQFLENSRVTHKFGYSKINSALGIRSNTFALIIISAMGISILMFFIIFIVLLYQKNLLTSKFSILNSQIMRFKKDKLLKRTIAPLSDETREENIKKLKLLVPKNTFSPSAYKQWTFQKTCLVIDYNFKNQYQISIDVYCNPTEWEIQFFGRNPESIDYLFNNIINSTDFLPETIDNYDVIDNRLIFKELSINESVEVVSNHLKDLLSRIEVFIKKNP